MHFCPNNPKNANGWLQRQSNYELMLLVICGGSCIVMYWFWNEEETHIQSFRHIYFDVNSKIVHIISAHVFPLLPFLLCISANNAVPALYECDTYLCNLLVIETIYADFRFLVFGGQFNNHPKLFFVDCLVFAKTNSQPCIFRCWLFDTVCLYFVCLCSLCGVSVLNNPLKYQIGNSFCCWSRSTNSQKSSSSSNQALLHLLACLLEL